MKNYMSYAEADELCDGLVREYLGKAAPIPHCIDIEGFVRDFLKCPVVYENFAEDDPNKLGFLSDGRSPLKIRKNGRILAVIFPINTIVLDRFLLRPEESNRKRFTLSHEVGHFLANRISPPTAPCFHRPYDSEKEYKKADLREQLTLDEWQANTLGASLLMPRFVMQKALKDFNSGRRLPVYGEGVFHPREKVIINKMADSLCVSYTALIIRLRSLGMLNPHPISEYIQKELRLGGA